MCGSHVYKSHLNHPAKFIQVSTARLPEPVKDEPSRLLGNADFLGKLHRRDSLAGGNEQVHGVNPLVQWDMGLLENGAGPNGKIKLTGIAAVEASPLAGGQALPSLACGAGNAQRP